MGSAPHLGAEGDARPASGGGPLDAGAAAGGVVVRELWRRYGDHAAVAGVDFAVAPGEVVGLLGPNGAGKTTTLRVLATLIRPTSGSATVGGVDVVAQPVAARAKLGFLTGDTGLYERLRPAELLRYFGALHGMPEDALRTRIEELQGALGIDTFAQQPCGTLSTGQTQRVSLARALLHDPPVLVLDEPTNGLDILSAQFLLGLLRRERARGKAILLSTHLMADVELVCDRVLLLHEGRIRDRGTVAELTQRHGGASLAEAVLSALTGPATGAP